MFRFGARQYSEITTSRELLFDIVGFLFSSLFGTRIGRTTRRRRSRRIKWDKNAAEFGSFHFSFMGIVIFLWIFGRLFPSSVSQMRHVSLGKNTAPAQLQLIFPGCLLFQIEFLGSFSKL